jgi:hypothetical protein
MALQQFVLQRCIIAIEIRASIREYQAVGVIAIGAIFCILDLFVNKQGADDKSDGTGELEHHQHFTG